jgi:hypothetical protein
MLLRTLHGLGLTNLTDDEVRTYERSVKPGPGLRAVSLSALAAVCLAGAVVVAGFYGDARGLRSMMAVERQLSALEGEAKALKEREITRGAQATSPEILRRLDALAQEIQDLRRSLMAVKTSRGGFFPGSSKLRRIDDLSRKAAALERELVELRPPPTSP